MPSPLDLTDRELDKAVLEASRLAMVVHEYDQQQVRAVLAHIRAGGQLDAVVIALAAMVDVEQPLSRLLAWVHDRADTESEEEPRKPWQRPGGYPPCDPDEDHSPVGCGSRHGTPARHTAGCRGAGCRAAKSDYDAYRVQQRKSRNGSAPS